MTPVTTAKEAIEAAADVCLDAAWKHHGNDAYSQGMDRGAAHQVEACVKAIRAIPVADPVGVAVKPLEWGGEFCDTAETPFCVYTVSEKTDETWRFSRSEYPFHDESDDVFHDQAEAQAAAQADYERRVLACLTVADDRRVAGLVEALEVSRKALTKTNQRLAAHGYEENSATRKPVWLALKTVRTALAAFATSDGGE